MKATAWKATLFAHSHSSLQQRSVIFSDLSKAKWSIRLYPQWGRCPVKAKKASTKQIPGKCKSAALQEGEKESNLAKATAPEPFRNLCLSTCTNTYLVPIWLFKTLKLDPRAILWNKLVALSRPEIWDANWKMAPPLRFHSNCTHWIHGLLSRALRTLQGNLEAALSSACSPAPRLQVSKQRSLVAITVQVKHWIRWFHIDCLIESL